MKEGAGLNRGEDHRRESGAKGEALPKGFYRPSLEDCGGSERKFKIDLTSELEMFLIGSCFAFAAIASVLFFISFSGDAGIAGASKYLQAASAVSAFLACVMVLLCRTTDNYYIMDGTSKEILFHSKFMGRLKVTPFVRFSEIYAITVTGSFERDDNPSYRIVAITNTTAMVNLSDSRPASKLQELNEKAGAMAAVTGCLYAECPLGGSVFIDHDAGLIKSLYFNVK